MNKVIIQCDIIIKNTNTHTHGADLIAIEMIDKTYIYLNNQEKMSKINTLVNDGYCLGEKL